MNSSDSSRNENSYSSFLCEKRSGGDCSGACLLESYHQRYVSSKKFWVYLAKKVKKKGNLLEVFSALCPIFARYSSSSSFSPMWTTPSIMASFWGETSVGVHVRSEKSVRKIRTYRCRHRFVLSHNTFNWFRSFEVLRIGHSVGNDGALQCHYWEALLKSIRHFVGIFQVFSPIQRTCQRSSHQSLDFFWC